MSFDISVKGYLSDDRLVKGHAENVGHFTISRAAARLDVSESTIQRDLKRGNLDLVSGDGPRRVTEESVERMRTERILRLGGFVTCPSVDADADLQLLRAENERLRTVIQELRVSSAALLDGIGHMTAPSVPND